MLRSGILSLLAGCLVGLSGASARAEPAPRPSSDALAAWLDARFYELWTEQGIADEASEVDDATFLRRVYLDLMGAIPSVAQVRDFLADARPDKRQRLIEQLSAEPRSAAHLSRIWRRIMVPAGSPNFAMGGQLEPWLAQQFASRVPFDEFARRLLTAEVAGGANRVAALGGPNTAGSPAAFYFAVGNTPDNAASSLSRVFLGVRIGCAKCHNHPFADWRQEDFWGMAAFFAGANLTGQAGADRPVTTIKPMESDKEYTVRFLWDNGPARIPDGKSPRQALADWMVSKENRNFAATTVNRMWQQLCGQGLIPQVDDLDQATTAERSKVLDELAQRFVESDFDLQWLIQGICKSRVYQRISDSRGTSTTEQSPLSTRRPLKTLTPEQVFDSLEQALMLPVSRGEQSPRYNGQRDQLVQRLNEASGESPDQFRSGIPQALMIMNGGLVSAGTDINDSRTLRAVVEAPFLEPGEKLEALFFAALTRKPDDRERERLLALIAEQTTREDRQRIYADIYWALLNSPEFVLCR